MKYFYITCSELAKLTGHNAYEPVSKTVNTLLNKFGIKSVYVPKSNIEEGLNTLSNQDKVELSKELSTLSNTSIPINKLEEAIKKHIVYPTQNGSLTEENSKTMLADMLKDKPCLEALNQYIQKDLRMRRGNIKESKNIDILQEKKQIKVEQRNSKMYTKELVRTDKYCIVLKGKVDGISNDTVVEAKNRQNRLFMELRDYERVQLEAYMFLTGHSKSVLTEHYNDTSNQIHYLHDEVFWQLCVDSTIQFIDLHIVSHIEE
jgi:hypothetical protein